MATSRPPETPAMRHATQVLGTVSTLLDTVDWAHIARVIERADALGPIMFPTEYRDSLMSGNLTRNRDLVAATRTYLAELHRESEHADVAALRSIAAAPPKAPQQPDCHIEVTETAAVAAQGALYQLAHDGPCVFVAGQCSCGRMDLGVVRCATCNGTRYVTTASDGAVCGDPYHRHTGGCHLWSRPCPDCTEDTP